MERTSIEKELARLTTAVGDLSHRVLILEQQLGLAPIEGRGTMSGDRPSGEPDVGKALSLAGRGLVVLGGAYLLRAITESSILPLSIGVVLGLTYATVWIVTADRSARRGRRLSAFFHGSSGAAIAYPLLWEATSRFGLLPAASGVLALAAVTALFLAVAYRRELRSLAWIAASGGTLTAGALLAGAAGGRSLPILCSYSILLALAVAACNLRRAWMGLAWLTASVADVGVLVLGSRPHLPRSELPIGQVVTVQLGFFGLFTALFIAAALTGRRRLDGFAASQTVAALLLGYGGALYLVVALGLPRTPLGAASLAAAAALYTLAFRAIERTSRRRFLYLSSLALALLLGGAGLVPPIDPSALWSLAAVVLTAVGWRISRPMLALQGALAMLAAAVASGLWTRAVIAFASATAAIGPLPAVAFGVLGAALICLAFPRVRATGRWIDGLPTGLHLLVAATGLAGLAVGGLAPLLAAPDDRSIDPGILAALRTGVLAATVMLLTWARRTDRYREAGWWLYPALLLGAIKLLVDDLPRGRAVTLFLSLAFYGGALIAVARSRSRGPRELPADGA